jgi:hypothetical protein
MNCENYSGGRMMSVHRIVVALCLFCAVMPAYAARAKKTLLKPKDAHGEMAIVSEGKSRLYYTLGVHRPSRLEVKGPGTLYIYTRAQFPAKGEGEAGYTLRYVMDKGEPETFTADQVVRAENAQYKDPSHGTPGDLKELRLSIPHGQHTFEIALADSGTKVHARFMFSARKIRTMKWVTLAPLSPSDPVDLIAGEETAHYYRFSQEKPLRIEIIGPTKLRVMTRVENSFNMKGRANYRLQIRQEGQVVQSFQLSSKRSETTSYKNNKKLVPGKAREVLFQVPKGRQRYDIVPMGKGPLLGQIMFPKHDAKLGL